MHIRRGTLDSDHLSKYGRNQRQVLSTGSSPVLQRNGHRVGREDVVSVDSLQWSEAGGYGGSVDSLPSLNTEEDTDTGDRPIRSLSSSQSSSQTSHLECPPLPLMSSTSEATHPPLRATSPAVLVSLSIATPHLSSSVPQPSPDTPNTPTTPTPSSHSYTMTSSLTTPSSSVISHSVIGSTASSPQLMPHSTMASSSLDSSSSSSLTLKSSTTLSSSSPVCETEHKNSSEADQSVEEMARELVEKSVLKALSQIHSTAH